MRNARHCVAIVGNDVSTALTLDVLLHHRYRSDVYGAPSAALDAFRVTRPDLVVVDIASLGAEHEALLHGLRGDPRLRDIPVVAAISNAVGSMRQTCLAAGFADTLSLPILDADILYELLDRALATVAR